MNILCFYIVIYFNALMYRVPLPVVLSIVLSVFYWFRCYCWNYVILFHYQYENKIQYNNCCKVCCEGDNIYYHYIFSMIWLSKWCWLWWIDVEITVTSSYAWDAPQLKGFTRDAGLRNRRIRTEKVSMAVNATSSLKANEPPFCYPYYMLKYIGSE